MGRGKFIVFEGIDGCGKSTQSKMIADYLTKRGDMVILTFEPTKGPIGSMIRSVFTHQMEADQRTVAGLFVADRLEHIVNAKDGMLQLLEQGYHVICDRYYFSSYAYHSVHMSMDWVIKANSLAASLLKPDLNIYIDLKPEISMQRLSANRTSLEMYENLDNLTKVYNNYTQAFALLKDQENIVTIDGNQPLVNVFQDILVPVNAVINS